MLELGEVKERAVVWLVIRSLAPAGTERPGNDNDPDPACSPVQPRKDRNTHHDSRPARTTRNYSRNPKDWKHSRGIQTRRRERLNLDFKSRFSWRVSQEAPGFCFIFNLHIKRKASKRGEEEESVSLQREIFMINTGEKKRLNRKTVNNFSVCGI